MPTNNSCNYSPTQHNAITGGASGAISSVAPGTSGNVLTSNGTDWTSAAASGGSFLTKSVTLTSAQIKAIHGTPIEIIAAPGAGKGILVISVGCKLIYGGTNVFTAGASQTIGLYYNNNTTICVSGTNMIANAMITANANKFSNSVTATNGNVAAGVLDNVNIAAFNAIATEITGNAANDNTIDVNVAYWIVTY